MEISYPQFISIDKTKKDDYLMPLITDKRSMFYGRNQEDVYFIAAALGLHHGNREASKGKRDGFRTYAGMNDRYKLLCRIIALAGSNYEEDVLLNGKDVLKIVEEYANGGLPILHNKIFEGGLSYSIEDEIWDEFSKRAPE